MMRIALHVLRSVPNTSLFSSLPGSLSSGRGARLTVIAGDGFRRANRVRAIIADGPPHTTGHAGPHQAVHFLAGSFRQIVN